MIILAVLLLKITPVYSLSQIHLQDDSLLKGNIISQTNDSLKIEVNFNILTINKSEIKEIKNIPDQWINIYLKNGSALRGKLICQDYKKIKILCDDLGEQIILKENIDHIDWQKTIKTKPTTNTNARHLKDETIETKASTNTNVRQQKGEKSKEEAVIKVTENIFSEEKTKPDIQKPKKKLYYDAAWRSAVLPSWGQFYKNHNIKAWIVIASETLFIGTTLGSYFYYNSLVQDYRKAPTQEKYDNLTTWLHINHTFFILSLVCHGGNIIDALITKPGTTLALHPSFRKDVFSFAVIRHRY